MKTCREIKPYFLGDLTEPQAARLREHLAKCPQCAKERRRARLARVLLQATLPDEPEVQLLPNFLVKLRARRAASAGEKWTFWELVWSFSRSFATVAVILLLLIGGLNLYTFLKEENESFPMQSYLIDPLADDVSLIMSEDVALTQERVLRTLVSVREGENGNQR